jgi:hypothetical protein
MAAWRVPAGRRKSSLASGTATPSVQASVTVPSRQGYTYLTL